MTEISYLQLEGRNIAIIQHVDKMAREWNEAAPLIPTSEWELDLDTPGRLYSIWTTLAGAVAIEQSGTPLRIVGRLNEAA